MNILFVDDSSLEILKLRKALSELNVTHHVRIVSRANDALSEIVSGAFLPNLIVADLNMPNIKGFELARMIKNSDLYKHIPIVIFTTSTSMCDVVDCFKSDVAGYLVKPSSYKEYLGTLRLLIEYWEMNLMPVCVK